MVMPIIYYKAKIEFKDEKQFRDEKALQGRNLRKENCKWLKGYIPLIPG